MNGFVPGLALSGRLYREAVRPVLARHHPGLAHSAALLGPGSEVLGFDTARSMDHDWGARLQLFVPPGTDTAALSELLAAELPPEVAGIPTNLVPADPAVPHGTRHLRRSDGGPVRHGVVVTELGPWLRARLGFDPRDGVTTPDWLGTPTQVLAEVTAGAVWHDGLGELGPVRAALAWYPDAVWRYVLACQWQRIAEEEPFPGRCAEAGDELGAALVTARLARDLIRLCLLLERRYPPYAKWLGTAFARLPGTAGLAQRLAAAVAARDRAERERELAAALTAVAGRHNAVGLTEPLDTSPRPFHDRPFPVLRADRFADALLAGVDDPALRDLPRTGAVDQFADSTAALGSRAAARALTAALYPR